MTTLTNTNNKSIKGGIDMDTLINAWTEYLMEVGFDRLDAYSMAYRKVVRKGIKTLPVDEKEYARFRSDDDGCRYNTLSHCCEEFSFHNNYNEYSYGD